MKSPRSELKMQLNDIIALAKRQITAAQSDDWELVEELQEKRQRQLQQHFSGKVAEDSAPLVRIGIEKLKALELQLFTITERAQVATAQTLQQTSKASKVSKAYSQHK